MESRKGARWRDKRTRLLLLAVALLYGCSSATPRPPRQSIGDMYIEAFDRHYASVAKWQKGIDGMLNCYKVANLDREKLQSCLDALLAPETFMPNDRKNDEVLLEYKARKDDEWEEKNCIYKGLMEARYLGESQRIQDQCLQTLEIKRLRKVLEKQQT